MTALVFAALASALSIALPPVPDKRPKVEVHAYWIDLERALLGTAEGKRIRAEFDGAIEAVEKDVQGQETRVYLLRKELERSGDPAARAKYDAEVEAIDQFIAREEKRLDEEQDRRLEPLLEKMREIMARASRDAKSPLVILDQSEHPIINLDQRCDVTAWLVRVYESKKEEAIAPIEACKTRAFCFVEIDRLMKSVEESKKASARLDVYQKEKQAELDGKQTELRRMEAKLGARSEGRAEYERARIELAARYSAYQQALKERERAEEKKVRDAARALVLEAARAVPGALFIDGVERDAEAPSGTDALAPRCDLGSWFVDLARRTTKLEDLSSACPPLDNGDATRRKD